MILSTIGDIASIIGLLGLLGAVLCRINKYMKSKIQEFKKTKEKAEKWSKNYLNLATNPAKRSEISLYLIIQHQMMKSREWLWILLRATTILAILISMSFCFFNLIISNFSFNIVTWILLLCFITSIVGSINIWYESAKIFKIITGFEDGVLDLLDNKISIYICENCSEDCSKRKN